MSNIASRLRESRLEKDWTQEVLAKKSGVSQGTIGNIEAGLRQSLGSLPRIAEALGLRHNWLRDGELPKFDFPAPLKSNHTVESPRADYNVQPVKLHADIPVLSWVAAGEFCDANEAFPEGAVEDWIPNPVRSGGRTFALRVRGESMRNPSGEPSFSAGDIIYCDPDKQAEHKSLVVVRLDDAKEATFKRLLIEGDTKMLEALNPSWPERIIKITGNATICGVVFGRYDGF